MPQVQFTAEEIAATQLPMLIPDQSENASD
jgi:hypothetical protein